MHLKVVDEPWRPRTRSDCADVPRPCPYVGCRYHLYLKEGNAQGKAAGAYTTSPAIDGAEIEDLEHSCALDLADENQGVGLTLEKVGDVLGVTRERVRQIERVACAKIADGRKFSDFDTFDKVDFFGELSVV